MSISSPEVAPKADPRLHSDRNYWLVLSLLSVLFIAYTAFAEGYRLPGWYLCKPAAIWGAVPLQIILLGLLGIQLIAAPSRSSFRTWLVLLAVTLALCLGGYGVIQCLGRNLVRWEVPPVTLANDCLQVHKQESGALGEERSLPLPPPKWPASIRRLRPMYVMIERDRVRLELHGGFDHYGYTLEKDEGQPSWVLEWYNEGASETLVTIPATD